MQALIKKNKIHRRDFKLNETNNYIKSVLINNKLLTNADKEILSKILIISLTKVSPLTSLKRGEGLSDKHEAKNSPFGHKASENAKRGARKASESLVSDKVVSDKNLKTMPQKGCGAISKVRNICILTGRTRALIQDYKVSRLKFKELAEIGYIPGVKKI